MRDRQDELVLALHPNPRGFAFALFEAPLSPVDWGLREVLGIDQNARTFELIARLCKSVQPDTIVLEDTDSPSTRKSERAKRLISLIGAMAEVEGITLAKYSREQVREAFHHASISRYEIAQAIATFVPALADRLPPMRKLWKSEDPRLWLFDAASFALTHYARVADDEPP